ncbi:MAG: hypothetical protein VXV74_05310, partial [Pseudomonadota bacterium]|nr:hypothetical protein [Pseudomonadota bacterium]
RGKQRVSIVSENGETSNYLIPKGKHINFNQGEEIKKGEYLLDGQPLPHRQIMAGRGSRWRCRMP